MTIITKRYDFVLLFDIKDGNPNGNPDAGNQPRVDAEAGEGLVTDVCLKRKIRNYVQLVKVEPDGTALPGFDIFIREKAVLNRTIASAYELDADIKKAWDEWIAHEKAKKTGKKSKGKKDDESAAPKKLTHPEDLARIWMCRKFFDVRTFGAVMTTGDKEEGEMDAESGKKEEGSKLKKTAGQVRGPVQLTFARSVHQIRPIEHTITRCAVTNEKDVEKERTMGNKPWIPYGLYRAHGYVSAPLAEKAEFGEGDLVLLWEALEKMFWNDQSAARNQMATQALYVFEHNCKLGNAASHQLFDLIEVVQKDKNKPPRQFSDFDVKLDGKNIRDLDKRLSVAQDVTLHRKVG